jgi:hypothetical protein
VPALLYLELSFSIFLHPVTTMGILTVACDAVAIDSGSGVGIRLLCATILTK